MIPGGRTASCTRSRARCAALPQDRDPAAHDLPGSRGGPCDAQVPLPGGGVGRGLRRPRALLPPRRLYGRPVRADRAHPAGAPRPVDLHADPAPQPVLAPGYRLRAALERIYRRIDHDFGFERHFVRGQARMQTRVGLSIAVMMAPRSAMSGPASPGRCARWSNRLPTPGSPGPANGTGRDGPRPATLAPLPESGCDSTTQRPIYALAGAIAAVRPPPGGGSRPVAGCSIRQNRYNARGS